MTLSPTARAAVDVYGGEDRWRAARGIVAEVSVTGLAFTLKRRPAFVHAVLALDVHRPQCRITPIGRTPGITGVLDGRDTSLVDAQGADLGQRADARAAFPSLRRWLWWDDLDMAYFANYAFWNYFTLPALLLRDDIRWTETRPGTLDAEFPASLPTHSRLQRFTFDPDSGRLRQHDYTADIISGLAAVAHVVHEHTETDGLLVPSRRIVTPRRRDGTPMRGPVMIDIRVHSFRLE